MIQTIAAASGVSLRMRAGDRLELIDVYGKQVSDLFCVEAGEPTHAFSAARTLDWCDKIFLTTGDVLWSNRSQRMLRIVEDTCGRHDLLMPPCSLRMFQLVSGNDGYHTSCHENLSNSLASSGVTADAIGCSFNAFMRVDVDSAGRLVIAPPKSLPGDRIVFEAEMDLIVGLTACSHEATNGGELKPIEFRLIPSNGLEQART
jgi:uncharacterized protein YcgI (DUF1989 family)